MIRNSNTHLLKQNGVIILCALIVTAIAYALLKPPQPTNLSLRQTENTDAQVSCDTSFFTINQPSGYTFSKSCVVNNVQMYASEPRYVFFQPQTELANAAYIQTPNVGIKDATSLNWSISTTRAATLYIMTRHIPGLNQTPVWISSAYSRVTNNDLSQIIQYMKRKNDQGLIGIYDIYKKEITNGTTTMGPASATGITAYSMYLTALVPHAQATPTPTPVPTATPVATPDPLLEEAKLHNTPTDCYTVYTDKTDGRHLYNITLYIRFHTGGTDSIASACGKEMTDRYDNGDPSYLEKDTGAVHKHTQASNDILRSFMVK